MAVGPYTIALQIAIGVVSNCIAVDGEILVEAIGIAALRRTAKHPVTLRVGRIDRNNFAALVTDIAEAQIVSGSGEIVCKTSKTPLRVIDARADRAITETECAAPGEIVPGVGGQCRRGYGTAFLICATCNNFPFGKLLHDYDPNHA